jgi:hypothetical protein
MLIAKLLIMLLLLFLLLKHNYILSDDEYFDEFDHIGNKTSSDRNLRDRSTTKNLNGNCKDALQLMQREENDQEDGKQNRFIYIYVFLILNSYQL